MSDLTWQCLSYLRARTVRTTTKDTDNAVNLKVLEETVKKQPEEISVKSKDELAVKSKGVSAIYDKHALRVRSWDGASLNVTVSEATLGSCAAANDIRQSDMKSDSFNQFLLRDEELAAAVVEVFTEMAVLEELHIPAADMLKMAEAAKARYHDQPYHNFRHAFDVFQATYALLHRTGFVHIASKVELLAIMAAALLHDVGHTGLSNKFHDQEQDTPYHLLAKSNVSKADKTLEANEYYHLVITRTVLLGDKGLLPEGQYDEALRTEVDALLKTLIHATDPATQSAYLKVVHARMAESTLDCLKPTKSTDREMALCLIMRCADIFHPLRPFNIHRKWALSIAAEFSLQGNMEAARGFKPSAMMDSETYISGLGKSTSGFIDFLVIPLITCLVKAFPSSLASSRMIERLKVTKRTWDSYDKLREQRLPCSDLSNSGQTASSPPDTLDADPGHPVNRLMSMDSHIFARRAHLVTRQHPMLQTH